jgi:hypothetical protein
MQISVPLIVGRFLLYQNLKSPEELEEEDRAAKSAVGLELLSSVCRPSFTDFPACKLAETSRVDSERQSSGPRSSSGADETAFRSSELDLNTLLVRGDN